MAVKIFIQANLSGADDDGNSIDGGSARQGNWIFEIQMPDGKTLPKPANPPDAIESGVPVEFEASNTQYQALAEAALAVFQSYKDVLDLSSAQIITNNQNARTGIQEAVPGVTVRVCTPGGEETTLGGLLKRLPKH